MAQKSKNLLRMKDLRVAIKNHKGTNDLLEDFDFNDAEELYEMIRQINPQEADQLIKEFQKNQKQNDKKVVKAGTQEKETAKVSAKEQVTETSTTVPKASKLEDMLAEKEKLQQELASLENESMELKEKLEELEKEIVGRNYIIEVLQRELDSQRQVLDAEKKECDSLKKKICMNGFEKNAHKELLKELDVSIENLKKVHIFVHEDWTFEVKNAERAPEEIECDMEMLTQLLSGPKAGELTINQVKNLVRLKTFTTLLVEKQVIFDISFEKNEMESLFNEA